LQFSDAILTMKEDSIMNIPLPETQQGTLRPQFDALKERNNSGDHSFFLREKTKIAIWVVNLK